jgi:hypothetical protein
MKIDFNSKNILVEGLSLFRSTTTFLLVNQFVRFFPLIVILFLVFVW